MPYLPLLGINILEGLTIMSQTATMLKLLQAILGLLAGSRLLRFLTPVDSSKLRDLEKIGNAKD